MRPSQSWPGWEERGCGVSHVCYVTILIARGYLGILSSYHIVTGAISFFSPGFALSFYKALYAVDPVEKRHLHIILRPWGALAMGIGVVGWFAAVDPVRYVGVILALLLLLILRAVYRIGLRHELLAISRIPSRRNWLNVALIVVGIIILAAGLCALWCPAANTL